MNHSNFLMIFTGIDTLLFSYWIVFSFWNTNNRRSQLDLSHLQCIGEYHSFSNSDWLTCYRSIHFYIAHYPNLRTAQCFTHYFPDRLFNCKPHWILWDTFSHAAINAQRLFIHKYPLLSMARYSFTQLTELEHCWCMNLPNVQHDLNLVWFLMTDSLILYLQHHSTPQDHLITINYIRLSVF